jgi:CelD/BcsL family acetyltransferase involved in cellulose biosynthesis
VYGFVYNKIFYYYQAGFDTEFYAYRAGYLILGMTIQSALEEGVTMYDLLRGEEKYKEIWRNETSELSNQEFYPARWRGYIRSQTTLLRGRFKRRVWKFMPDKLKT